MWWRLYFQAQRQRLTYRYDRKVWKRELESVVEVNQQATHTPVDPKSSVVTRILKYLDNWKRPVIF